METITVNVYGRELRTLNAVAKLMNEKYNWAQATGPSLAALALYLGTLQLRNDWNLGESDEF